MSAPPPGGRLRPFIAQIATGARLSEAEARDAFDIIMSGDATPSQIGGFVMALRVRGESVEEITGAAQVMREKATRVAAPPDAVDCCGTGGDGVGSLNVSTAVSFVLAGAGVPVAKHGNRALSSRAGAADTLIALGVDIDCAMERIEQAIAQAGVGFLMAPRHHTAMRHVGPTRVELGTRTIFNVLGPLANPAGVDRQLVGVFSADWLEPMATVLQRLGTQRAWVVHGADGLDEISLSGPTEVVELAEDKLSRFTLRPEDAELETRPLDAVRGGDAETNAAALADLLGGERGPYRDIVLLNAAAALIVAGRAGNLVEGVAMATQSIDGGAARQALDRLVAISRAGVAEAAG